MSLTVVIGGARSGKSAHGERLAAASGRPVRYVATADGSDPAMARRIGEHVARRPQTWSTVVAGDDLLAALAADGCSLVDGLGTWIAGVLHRAGAFEAPVGAALERAGAHIRAQIGQLIEAGARAEVIVVAEEAGQGLVPGDAVSREWLDLLGEATQRLSAAAERLDFVVAGRVIPLGRSGAPARDAEGRVIVVGIGADGWSGLGDRARAAILGAEEVIGSRRQLELLPAGAPPGRPWPSPIEPLVDEIVARSGGTVCVLASGDPMLHGIGVTLSRRLPANALTVIPHASAFSLACARLGWAEAEVELLSTVARPPQVVSRVLQPGRRAIVYVSGSEGAAAVARVLCAGGFAASRFVVMEQLGGDGERLIESTAGGWGERLADPLHAVAIECAPSSGAPLHALVPGLPDAAYEHDGALTKRHIRAATLAALAPAPGARLWDVGAGSGSVAIEWLRSERSALAVAVEQRPERCERIERNALALGVPGLEILAGSAPAALDALAPPDAVFIGGGLGTPGVLERCWEALAPAGRIVANAVTLEGEQILVAACRDLGGQLVRIEISHAEPIGGFTGWRPQRPVVQWAASRSAER